MHDLLHRFSLKTIVGSLFAALAFFVQFFLGADIRADLTSLTAAVVNFANAAAFLCSTALMVWGHIESQLKHERTISALSQATPPAPVRQAAPLPASSQARSTVLPVFAVIALTLGCLEISGCAGTPAASGDVATDVASDLGQGLVVAQDVFTAANAVEENNTGGKLNVAKVLSDAQAAQTSANSTGLATAVNVLVADVNDQIAQQQAAGASPAEIVTAAATTTATAQVTAASTPVPAAPATNAAPSTSALTPKLKTGDPQLVELEVTASF